MIGARIRSIMYGMLCAVLAAAPWLFWKRPHRMFNMTGGIFLAFFTVVTLVVPLMNLKRPFLHRIHPSIYGFFVTGYILSFFVIPFKICRDVLRELAQKPAGPGVPLKSYPLNWAYNLGI